MIHAWPDEVLKDLPMDGSTYIVILTHDPKFDDPTITAALQGRPRYIGAIGSQKTHRERVARLTAAGVGEIERVHAPIGLDLGAQTAEETALAILSQMVAVRHRKLGGPMPGSAVAGKTPSELYRGLVARYGDPAYARIDSPATREQKAALAKLSPDQITADRLAGEKITAVLTEAPGNGEPIGGLKVVTETGWFAARPSGTEDVYKLYAESFRGPAQLAEIQEEARAVVAAALG